jgi:cytochrome c5
MSCAACHDNGLEGAPRIGDPAAWHGLSSTASPIAKSHAVNGNVRMAPKGGNPTLSDKEVESAVAFMLLKSKGPRGIGLPGTPN